MDLSKKELRREVKGELCEALRFCGRAANLLRHACCEAKLRDKEMEVLETAEALERIMASTAESIDRLLSE